MVCMCPSPTLVLGLVHWKTFQLYILHFEQHVPDMIIIILDCWSSFKWRFNLVGKANLWVILAADCSYAHTHTHKHRHADTHTHTKSINDHRQLACDEKKESGLQGLYWWTELAMTLTYTVGNDHSPSPYSLSFLIIND